MLDIIWESSATVCCLLLYFAILALKTFALFSIKNGMVSDRFLKRQ
jgi:hypothetical protein